MTVLDPPDHRGQDEPHGGRVQQECLTCIAIVDDDTHAAIDGDQHLVAAPMGMLTARLCARDTVDDEESSEREWHLFTDLTGREVAAHVACRSKAAQRYAAHT